MFRSCAVLAFLILELQIVAASLDCSNIEAKDERRELKTKEFGRLYFKRLDSEKRTTTLKVMFDDAFKKGAHIWDSPCIRSQHHGNNGEWTIQYDFDSRCRQRDGNYQIRFSVKKHNLDDNVFEFETESRIKSFKIDGKDVCQDVSDVAYPDVAYSDVSAETIIKEKFGDDDVRQNFDFEPYVNDEEATNQLQGGNCNEFLIEGNKWKGGLNGKLKFKIPTNVNGWKIMIQFKDSPVQGLNVNGAQLKKATNNCKFLFRNQAHNKQINAGSIFSKDINFYYQWDQKPQPTIGFVQFVSNSLTMQCGQPQCSSLVTSPPQTTTTQSSPVETLKGDACEDYVTVSASNQGSEQGEISFKVPNAVTSWEMQVGFDMQAPGFNIQQGANKISTSDSCESYTYVYENAGNTPLSAGSSITFSFFMNFDRNEATPQIMYIKFGSSQCGTIPTCPTTAAPTTITNKPTTVTNKPTTVTNEPTTVTNKPTTIDPEVLSQSCDSFITKKNSWNSGYDGEFTFVLQSTVKSWEITIEFDSTISDLQFHNGNEISGNNCNFVYQDKGWNGEKSAGESFGEQFLYRYQQDKSPKPKIAFVKFVGDDSSMLTCGTPQNCGTITNLPPTTKPPPATTAPPGTKPSPATTAPPTTKPPPATTAPPTTKPPPATTAPPTTKPSPATTAPPTTKPPPATTAPPTSNPPQTTTPPTQPETTVKKTTKTTEGPTETTSSPICNTKHDLREVLRLSNIFYKAQRSGDIPDNDPDVPWRKDSFLNEGDKGRDLTGGYFDAGDYVKFGFPMAAASTLIAWGLVEFEDGYKYAGQHAEGLSTLKWATDYFIKCHTGTNEFYGQCGLGGPDHSFWGRPEEYPNNIPRPCMKISSNNGGGSDLAGETAAALAAASMAFSESDPGYSAILLVHARGLYNFAINYQQSYVSAIGDAGGFYNSWSGYKDELAWSAAWMYKVTGENKYLNDAELYWEQMQQTAGEFSWDNKGRGVAVLLGNLIPGANKYKTNAQQFCEQDFPGKPTTPRGIKFVQQWGSNRHAANIAFICLAHSKYQGGEKKIKKVSRGQIELMLGDESKGQRSFVVGYGYNYPTQPHHRSSSCPNTGSCGNQQQYAPGPNPQVLKGALVGGDTSPGGGYKDVRSDYVANEVAVDYNAGFQSAVAAILSLEADNDCGE